jgi:hypothetical protein
MLLTLSILNMEFDIRDGFMDPCHEHRQSNVTGYVAAGPQFFSTHLPPHTYQNLISTATLQVKILTSYKYRLTEPDAWSLS